MINPHASSIQSLQSAANPAGVAGSSVRNTFQSIVAELKVRPLKPLVVQRFAAAPPRSLAQQVLGDTSVPA